MSKRKRAEPPPEQTRRLKFNGDNGYPFIIGIPARDLEERELIELSLVKGMTVDNFTAMLCTPVPGRQIADGKPLYSPNKPYLCPECGAEFTVWDDMHEHALEHVQPTENTTEESGE